MLHAGARSSRAGDHATAHGDGAPAHPGNGAIYGARHAARRNGFAARGARGATGASPARDDPQVDPGGTTRGSGDAAPGQSRRGDAFHRLAEGVRHADLTGASRLYITDIFLCAAALAPRGWRARERRGLEGPPALLERGGPYPRLAP